MNEKTPLLRNINKQFLPGTKSLNHSQNVLLNARLVSLRLMGFVSFIIALYCLIYCGINVTLLYCNYCMQVEAWAGNVSPVSDYAFHLTEFWSTFVFGIAEAVALMNTPKKLLDVYENPLALKLVLLFNVMATLVPALLTTYNLDYFEIISHELEYMNEITMSLIDIVILFSLWRTPDCVQSMNTLSHEDTGWTTSLVITTFACCIVLVQLYVYNWYGKTPNGDMVGEAAAHYFEFVFEIVSSMIVFWFTIDGKVMVDKEIEGIFYRASHDLNNAESV